MAGATYDAEREPSASSSRPPHRSRLRPGPGPGLLPQADDRPTSSTATSRLADTVPSRCSSTTPPASAASPSPSTLSPTRPASNIVGMKDSASCGIEHFLPLQRRRSTCWPDRRTSSSGNAGRLRGRDRVAGERVPRRCPSVVRARARPGHRARCAVPGLGDPGEPAISGAYGVPGVKAAITLAGNPRSALPRRPLLALDVARSRPSGRSWSRRA